MSKGKHEVGGGLRKVGDPFQEERPKKPKAKKKKHAYGWNGWSAGKKWA